MLDAELSRALQRGDYSVTTLPDGSAVLLDLHQESVLTFNGTGAFMLACLGEGADAPAITERVVARYEVDEATARADVERFVGELAEAVGMSPEA